jgi:hypothetical protein
MTDIVCCKDYSKHNMSTKEKQNTDCCTKPSNELKKTRHYVAMSKRYFTRLEDKIKYDLKQQRDSCC